MEKEILIFDKKNNLFDLIFKQLNKKIEWL